MNSARQALERAAQIADKFSNEEHGGITAEEIAHEIRVLAAEYPAEADTVTLPAEVVEEVRGALLVAQKAFNTREHLDKQTWGVSALSSDALTIRAALARLEQSNV